MRSAPDDTKCSYPEDRAITVAGAALRQCRDQRAARLVEVFRRRRLANRLGYAVQLGYLHHPGWAFEPGKVLPAAMLTVLAAQTRGEPDAFGDYAARDTT